MKIPVPVLVLTCAGIICGIASCSILIVSQVKQYWIYYITTLSGSITITTPFTFSTTYVATINAEIGLWKTYYTVNTDFANALVPDTLTADTVDSAKTDYFDEASVKACRALAIISTIAIFASIVCGIVTIFLTGTPGKIVRIVAVSTSGLTAFLATVSLIVVRTQFKDGMSIEKSYKMCIGSAVLAGVTTGCFVAALVLSADSNRVQPFDGRTETEMKPTIDDKVVTAQETKSKNVPA